MRSTLALLAVGAVAVSAAAVPDDIPQMKRNIIARQKRNLIKRNSLTEGADDATILSFALILEHLEDNFYAEALKKFSAADFEAAGYTGVYQVLEQVAADEHAHVEFLTAGLTVAGANPPQACNYTFPYTDVPSFLALSQVIEGVGVSAYLGAAGDISDKGYLTAAGSILTVEARHNAFVRVVNQYTPAPQPFDTPLSASNVVGIASPFFVSCPSGSAPTIKPPPAITVSPAAATIGGTINVAFANASAVNTSGKTLYCGFASGLQAAFSPLKNGSCMVPTQNVTTGQTYVLVTSGPSLADAYVVGGAGIIDTTPKNTSIVLAAAVNATESMNSSSSASTAKAGSQAAATNAAVSTRTVGGAALAIVAGALSLVF